MSLQPGVALAHRLKVRTSHRALFTISASPVHNDSPPSVCCALKCSAEISTGAEIPFRCRGGQYMVKFQRVIPGAGHTKNAVWPYRPLSLSMLSSVARTAFATLQDLTAR